MDGDWHNLGGALSENAEEPVALQPLLWIDEYIGRGLGCGMDRSPPCPGRRNHHAGSQEARVVWPSPLWLRLRPRNAPPGLSVLLHSNALKQTLQPYCLGGPFGGLMDAESEWLGAADVHVFETEGRISRGGAVRSCLSLPPHRRPARRTANSPHTSTKAGLRSMTRVSRNRFGSG